MLPDVILMSANERPRQQQNDEPNFFINRIHNPRDVLRNNSDSNNNNISYEGTHAHVEIANNLTSEGKELVMYGTVTSLCQNRQRRQ